MKNIIFTIALTAVSLLLSSCEKDFLDTNPKDALSPKVFWKTQKDLDLALTGCYNNFENCISLLYRDCGSDNAYNNFPWEGWTSIGNGTLSAASPGSSYYSTKEGPTGSFVTINRCNEFINNCDLVGIVSESNRKIYKAQARFIRAYIYYKLTVNYGDVPLILNNPTKPKEAKLKRDPKEKIHKFIEKELQEIIKVLPEFYSNREYGKVTKGAAQALLMRFYLYFKNYNNALLIAKDIKGYSLFPGFEKLFNPSNEKNGEVILSIQYTKDTYSTYFGPFLPNSIGGWSSIVPTQSLVDAFEMKDGKTIQEALAIGEYNPENPYINRDPRLRASIIYPGQIFGGKVYRSIEEKDADYFSKANNASKTGYNLKKYNLFWDLNPDAENNDVWNVAQDFYIFRYAEILLTIAEAKIELNQIDNEMYSAIDQIRERAGMPKVNRLKYHDQESLRKLVRNERRVEFAMEGLRRDDIIRWDIAKNVMNGDLMGCKKGRVLETIQQNGDHNVLMNLPANKIESRVFEVPKNNLLPIPQSSIDKNPNLLPNNPGF